ncbi:hypothetical protein OIO90_003514 [Microbotryomycetes sp. JL221]|nr:hypothetical protein OIO90_003514 [Microbotryomycetes sp. JL221]
MASAQPQLDHLILLVSSIDVGHLAFLENAGFSLQPGGKHADGLTENVLITLDDGVYIEVIAFCADTSAQDRSNHWWGRKREGWIDWCLAPTPLSAQERVNAINIVARESVYQNAAEGGRLNKQRQMIKWRVAFPVVGGDKGERSVRPFWCEDITDRTWRVPRSQQVHSNRAAGVSSLTLLSNTNGLTSYLEVLKPILGASPKGQSHQFELGSPNGSSKIKVFVKEPATEDERSWIQQRGQGLFSVTLQTDRTDSPVQVGVLEQARMALE